MFSHPLNMNQIFFVCEFYEIILCVSRVLYICDMRENKKNTADTFLNIKQRRGGTTETVSLIIFIVLRRSIY